MRSCTLSHSADISSNTLAFQSPKGRSEALVTLRSLSIKDRAPALQSSMHNRGRFSCQGSASAQLVSQRFSDSFLSLTRKAVAACREFDES